MTSEINELAELAYDGGTMPLTTTPVVGTPIGPYADGVGTRRRVAASRRDPSDDPR